MSSPSPVLMNPKPLSVNLLMVPSAISAFSVVIAWTDAARLTLPTGRRPVVQSVTGRGGITQGG